MNANVSSKATESRSKSSLTKATAAATMKVTTTLTSEIEK